MLKSLLQESFGGLNAGIVENQGEEPGIFSILAESVGSEFFGGVTPDGKAYSTFSVEDDIPATGVRPKAIASTNPLATQQKPEVKSNGKGGQLSAPEQALSETEKVITALVTTIASPLLMPIDALAIKADLIPTPDQLLSTTLRDLATAAEAYRQIPGIVAQDPNRQAIIQEAARTALKIAIPQPAEDVTWEKPTAKENEIAIQQAYDIVKQAIAEIGDTSCQSCGQLPCRCGASEIEFSLPDVLEKIKLITEKHNSRLALEAASSTVVNNVRRQAAGAIQNAIGDKPIEVLHIPPKSLLTGAFLGDWKEIVPAIIASVIENESGKRGASIALRPKPGTKEGGSLIVNMTEIGQSTDSDEFPLTAITTWEQSILQQSLSDKRSNRARWGRTKHGTIPEVGNLNIVSPGNSAVKQKIPVAVRFPHTDRDSQGGASILNYALSQLAGVQIFLKDAQSALATPDLGNDAHALTQSATVEATRSLEKNGIRPGVIARKTHEIVSKILDDQDANPTLNNIAQQVHLSQKQELSAVAKASHDQATLNLALTNLQVGLTHELVLRNPDKFVIKYEEPYTVKGESRSATREVYVLDRDTNQPVLASQVSSLIKGKKPQPSSWEVHGLPPKDVNADLVATAIETLASISPTPRLWQQIISGEVDIPDNVDRRTISKAMLAINSQKEVEAANPPSVKKRSLAERAADNIDLAVALITPRRKSK